MKLKLKYGAEADIPEGFASLYTERGGEWVLTGVEGMKTTADTDKLNESLTSARAELKEAKDKLAKLGSDPDLDEIVTKLDDYDDMKTRLDAGQGGEVDEEKIEKMVEARVNRQLRPVERERDQLREANNTLTAENGELKGTLTTGTIEGELRKLGRNEKVLDTALDDIIDKSHIFEIADDGTVVTKEGIRGVEPGTPADIWLTDMKEARPHWWAPSEGGGAGGGGGGNSGSNPWSKDGWSMEEQGKMVRTDRAKAERMAAAAGSKIGAFKPAE